MFAEKNGIKLHDGADLVRLIRTRTPEQQQALLDVALEGDYWLPTCVHCGIKMVDRAGQDGDSSFWGRVNSLLRACCGVHVRSGADGCAESASASGPSRCTDLVRGMGCTHRNRCDVGRSQTISNMMSFAQSFMVKPHAVFR